MILKSILLLIATSLILNVSSSSIQINPTINALNLKKLFEGAKQFTDLTTAFYSIKGLELFGEKLDQKSEQDVCNLAKSKVDKNNLESIYYATSIASLIPNCALKTDDFKEALVKGASSSSVADLYYFAFTSSLLKQPIDSKKLSKSVTDALKTDSSIINQAYSLHIATLLSEDAKNFYENIDDILDQADEVDKKYLQYEGGVGTTSLVLEGIILLSEKLKQIPAKFDQQRLVKFVNYLTSKRSPTNIKSAYFLLRTSIKLTDNQFLIPLILNRISPVSISSSNSAVIVSLTNLLGGAVKQAQFNLDALSAKSKKENGQALLTAKKSFVSKSSDSSTYELKLIEASQQVNTDFYKITVSVSPKQADKRFFLVDNTLEVKVTTQAIVTDVQVATADRDQTAPKFTQVNEQNKAKLDADQQSKFHLKFNIKDKVKNSLIEAHQAFVKFTQANTGREIIFLAQAGLNKQYTAEIDFSSNAKNFRHSSGAYSVELIVADALFENQILLPLADVKIKFSDEQANVQDKASLYSKKPEIKHLFRPPEPTPSKVVSTVFAALCIVPLGLLVVLWLSIGFNFSKFSFSLSAIVFHLSILAIFGLFYCYWIKLNMFQTIQYLAILGLFAFVSGSKLLKNLATSKEKSN